MRSALVVRGGRLVAAALVLVVVSAAGVSAPALAQSGGAPDGRADREFGTGSVTATFEGRETTAELVVEPADPVAGQTVTVSFTPSSPWPARLTIGDDRFSPTRPASVADCAAVVDRTLDGRWSVYSGFTDTQSLDASVDATALPSQDFSELVDVPGPASDDNEDRRALFECTGTRLGAGVLVWWDIAGHAVRGTYVIPESTPPGLYTLRFAPSTDPFELTFSEVSFPLIRVRAAPESAPVSGTDEVAPLGGTAAAGDSQGDLTLVASVVPSSLAAGWLAAGSALAAAGVAVLLGASLRSGPGRRGRRGAVLAALGASALGATVAVAGTGVAGADAVVPLAGSGVVVVTGLASPGWAMRWVPWVGGLRRRTSPPGGLVVPLAAVLFGGFTGANASLAGLDMTPAVGLGVAGGLAAGGVALLTVNRSKGREVTRRSAGWAATLLTLVAYATAAVPAVGTDVLTIVAPVVVGVIALVILLRPDPADPAPPVAVDGPAVAEAARDDTATTAVTPDPDVVPADDEVTR